MTIDEFMQSNQLPAAYADSAQRCYLPFADWLNDRLAHEAGATFVLGINGAQGTGKSTLAQLLGEYLAVEHDRRVVILSIDDLYLSRAERDALAERVHPLLKTRGVPGTHDVSLGISIIEQLKSLEHDEPVAIPRFDKSRDDRCAPADWSSVTGPVDLLIFEGWCVGSQPQDNAELQNPLNVLESLADADGRWRHYVNDQLAGNYVRLFAALDALLFLQAPDFAAILRWRRQQEHQLRDRAGKGAHAVMSDAEVAEFIQYYERITRNNLKVLPPTATAVIKIGQDHQAISLDFSKDS